MPTKLSTLAVHAGHDLALRIVKIQRLGRKLIKEMHRVNTGL